MMSLFIYIRVETYYTRKHAFCMIQKSNFQEHFKEMLSESIIIDLGERH